MYRNLLVEHSQFDPNCFINETDLLHNKPFHLTQICYLTVMKCKKIHWLSRKICLCSLFVLIRVLVHKWNNDSNEEKTKILHYLLRVTTVIYLKICLMTELKTNFIQKEGNHMCNFNFGSQITCGIIEMLMVFIQLR